MDGTLLRFVKAPPEAGAPAPVRSPPKETTPRDPSPPGAVMAGAGARADSPCAALLRLQGRGKRPVLSAAVSRLVPLRLRPRGRPVGRLRRRDRRTRGSTNRATRRRSLQRALLGLPLARLRQRVRLQAPGDLQGGERTNGPNFNQRKESRDDVLYAIRNGGFSGAIMPANIVVGEDAEAVADFLPSTRASSRETTRSCSISGRSVRTPSPHARLSPGAAPTRRCSTRPWSSTTRAERSCRSSRNGGD